MKLPNLKLLSYSTNYNTMKNSFSGTPQSKKLCWIEMCRRKREHSTFVVWNLRWFSDGRVRSHVPNIKNHSTIISIKHHHPIVLKKRSKNNQTIISSLINQTQSINSIHDHEVETIDFLGLLQLVVSKLDCYKIWFAKTYLINAFLFFNFLKGHTF